MPVTVEVNEITPPPIHHHLHATHQFGYFNAFGKNRKTTMSRSVFLDCRENSEYGNTTDILQCISDQFQEDRIAKAKDLNDFLLVIAGAMIFFMQSGFAMLCAGSVRLKNVQNTMLKNLLDACGAALAFYLVGEYKCLDMLVHLNIVILLDTLSLFCT